jgi:hypothetical protein
MNRIALLGRMKMTDAFCIHCGMPLSGAKNFCPNCGKPAGGWTGAKGVSPAPGGEIFERLAAKLRRSPRSPLLSVPELPLTAAFRLLSLRSRQAATTGTSDPDQVTFDRVWEPNQYAFTVLVPKGWKFSGGMFDVNPLQANGPGNSMAPKCDFAVMSDDQGSMMMRWMPSWNFADLSYSPSGGTQFPPGQWYEGMPVRIMVSARQFVWEMLQAERPRATRMTIVAEDSVQEITAAFYQQTEPLNRALQQAGLPGWSFESWDMRVEYTEDGQLYREEAVGTIGDYRRGGSLWMNDYTFMLRAPAPLYPQWGRVLEQIRQSLENNPEWLAAVEKGKGERARIAWETQQYINQVMAEIIAKRQAALDQADQAPEEEGEGQGEG